LKDADVGVVRVLVGDGGGGRVGGRFRFSTVVPWWGRAAAVAALRTKGKKNVWEVAGLEATIS